MSFTHCMQYIFAKRRQGSAVGCPSFCTANMTVLEAALQYAKDTESVVLIEATSNQCNQFGGYASMTPARFRMAIHALADRLGLPRNAVMLGGDHLGPLPWHTLSANEAMQRATTLVHDFVLAGFEKIHLDTSMYLGDDDKTRPLSKDIVAARGVHLYQTAMQALAELREVQPDAPHPVFVIGSEVPPAGGAAADNEHVKITSAADMEETLQAYSHQFSHYGIQDAWNHIVALVVQLGIDYSNTKILRYNHEQVMPLCAVLDTYPQLLFEAHSTDFQSMQTLRTLVDDGAAILKVGPALTFAFREALSCLVRMEEELIKDSSMRSHFLEILDEVMVSDPSKYHYWYRNSSLKGSIARRYSLLDRARYYLPNDRVQHAIHKLMKNIDTVPIPLGLLHYYMPMQYYRLVNKGIPISARVLVMDYIRVQIEDYATATRVWELPR